MNKLLLLVALTLTAYGSIVTPARAQTNKPVYTLPDATVPLPALSCFYVAERSGATYVDRDLCSNYSLAIGAAPNTRSIATSGLLTGGGNLTADRTISIAPQAACTIVANATAGLAAPTAVGLGTGLACSGGQIVNTGSGSGDVVGPAIAVDNRIAAFDGTTGKLIKDGGILTSSVLVSGGALGTPISGNLANTTGLPLTTGVTGILPAANGGTGNGFTAFSGPATSTKTFTLPNASSTILTSNSPVTVAQGGTGLAAGTSGGIPGYTATGTIASSGVLPAGMPVIGGGAGAVPSAGTRSGNTTKYVSMDASTPATNDCAKWDASGNLTTAGAACGVGGGSIVVTGGATTVDPAVEIQFNGTQFSIVDAGAGVATVKQTTTVRTITTTSGTIDSTDENKVIRTTNAGAVTLALPAAATVGANFSFYLECDGAAGCTIDPNLTELIDNASTLVVSSGTKVFISTDNTSWRGAVLSSKDPRNASNLASGTVPSARGGAGIVNGVMVADGAGNVSAGVDGTHFSLITAVTCPGTDKLSAVTAAGTFTCTADTGTGGAIIVTDGTTPVNPTTTLSFNATQFDVVDAGAGTATVKQITTVRTITGTSGTIDATDEGKTIRTTNAAQVTLNLGSSATLGANFWFYLECDGAGGCIIDPATTETIDGDLTLTVSGETKSAITADGAGWRGAVFGAKDPSNASNLASGTVPVGRLGASGTPSGTTYLNGLNQWTTPAGAGTVAVAFATIGWTPGIDLTKAVVLGPVPSAVTITDIRGKLIVAEGSAATVMVRKAASTEDCTLAAGAEAQTTTTFNLNGTAPANQNLTLVTGAANTLAAGDSLCLEVTGTTLTTKGSLNVTYTTP